MRAWGAYQACCVRAADNPQAAFCNVCGNPLLRCMAASECKGLVSPRQECPKCIALDLMLDADADLKPRKGERLSVPLVLRNASPAGRPVWIKQVVKRDGDREQLVPLTWEHLEPATERNFTIDAPPLAEGGTQTLSVLLVVASRYKGLEEEYVFSSPIRVSVSSEDSQQKTVNITVSGEGHTISADGMAIGGKAAAFKPGSSESSAPAAARTRVSLPLQRAERWELQNDIRGYREQKLRVPRDVAFSFSGFRREDAPGDAIVALTGRLACGRNSRGPFDDPKVVANDLCLRAYNRGGAVDEPATLAISRHHLDLVVINDRLCVQVRSRHGLDLSGRRLASGEVAPFTPSDRLVPILDQPDKLTLQAEFAESYDWVDRIDIRRSPKVVS